jgi:HK97 family phage portal protein
MEFLAMRKFSIEEIARLYRVPLHMIGSLDRATFSNIEQQSIEWAMHTVRPWCRRIEARVNISLFGPREANTFFAEFNLDGLLRGDSEGRSKYYATMRTAGILTANEIREKENFNPIAGGDDLLVQGAMIPATQAGDTQ